MFETMFKTVPIPLVVTRTDGTLVMTNDASVQFSGAARGTMGIKSISEVYANPIDRDVFIEGLKRDGRVAGFETSVRVADGTLRAVLLAGNILEIGGESFVMSAVVDITERKAAKDDYGEQQATMP